MAEHNDLQFAELDRTEPEQRRELLDPSPQLQDLLSAFRLREVRNIQRDHDRRYLASRPRAIERATPRSVATVASPVH